MRGAWLFFLSLVLTAYAGDQRLGVERTQDLGFGFHRDVIAEAVPPSPTRFESVGHFEYLFYRDQKLAALNGCPCLLAPCGSAIVYQDGRSGELFQFKREAMKTAQLTEGFPGLALHMVWSGSEALKVFVVSSAQSPESSGRWIVIPIPKT